MTLTIIPIIAMLIGLCLYLFFPHAKVAEIGRIMFFCGMLAILMGAGKASLSIH